MASTEQTVNQLFPFGERSGDQSAAVAALISELVRNLNHATVTSREAEVSLPTPQDVDRVVAGLALAVRRMPQLVQQVSSRLVEMSHHLEGADGRPPYRSVAIIEQDLSAVITPLLSAAAALDRAHGDIGRLRIA